MKRAFFLALWTAIPAMIIFVAWTITWDWLVRAGIAIMWTQDLVDRIEVIAYLTYIAVPLLGLILGLFGKLPGTHLGRH